MPFHAFVTTLDATKTDAAIKADIDSFFTTNSLTDVNIKTMAMARHAKDSEKYLLIVSAAI